MAGPIFQSRASDDPTGCTTSTTVGASLQPPEEMSTFLLQRGIIPTENDIILYENAFANLSRTLLGEEIQEIEAATGLSHTRRAIGESHWLLRQFDPTP